MLLRDKVIKLRSALHDAGFQCQTTQFQINNIEKCLSEGKLEYINENLKLIKDRLEIISINAKIALSEAK